MEPTVFTDVKDHMMIAQEESFGPVMVVSKFNARSGDGFSRVSFAASQVAEIIMWTEATGVKDCSLRATFKLR